jgi:hypothetical protein
MKEKQVFAVLNLVSGGALFPIDYEKALLDVYRYRLLTFWERKNLQFMSHIDNSLVDENEAIGWPSWVPRHWKGVTIPGQVGFSASGSVQL